MSILVAVQQRVPTDLVGHHLEGVRRELGQSPKLHSGRVHERVFQSLQDPGHFLSICEWRDMADFDGHMRSCECSESKSFHRGTRQVWQLSRLRHVVHMSHRVSVVACALVTGPAFNSEQLTQVGINRSKQMFEQQPGLVSVELYRMGDRGSQFLSVHGWRALDDLLAFMGRHSDEIQDELQQHEANIERFAGSVTAEYGEASEWPAVAAPPWVPQGNPLYRLPPRTEA